LESGFQFKKFKRKRLAGPVQTNNRAEVMLKFAVTIQLTRNSGYCDPWCTRDSQGQDVHIFSG
jgi:hypothetical protein